MHPYMQAIPTSAGAPWLLLVMRKAMKIGCILCFICPLSSARKVKRFLRQVLVAIANQAEEQVIGELPGADDNPAAGEL